MGEFSDHLYVLAPDGGNRMGGVTCDPFHAQIDNMDKLGCSSGKQKATIDAARPINHLGYADHRQLLPRRPHGMVLHSACRQLRRNLQEPPTSRTMERRTLREFGRLASNCYPLRQAPRRLHHRRRRATKRLQMDIAQPPNRCRLRR
jgi:CTP synthase (UTP-ammonia lyase)